MPADTYIAAERVPRPGRYLIPGNTPRRAELIAACAVLAVLVHLLFAQLTLILAVLFQLSTRATRWRPQWLAVPAVAGVLWTLGIGPAAAGSGFADGPGKVAAYLGGIGQHPGRLLHFGAAYAGMGHWLPRQLPLALIVASAEAALAAWLGWLHTDEWNLPGYRPGLLTFCRRAYLTRFIASGGVVGRDGACLGLDAVTGSRSQVSWPEAAGGVLVTGSPGSGATTTSFQFVHAAIRLRKPVIAVDLDGNPQLAESVAALCAATGAPLLRFPSGGSAYYDPLRSGEPARRTALVMGMIDWDGVPDASRRTCAAYLADMFAVLDAAPGDPRTAVLDEVVHLLNPAALQARLAHVPGYHPRRKTLAERVRVSVGLLEADPRSTAALTGQLNELRGSPLGGWLAPGPASRVDLGRVVRERAVAYFSLDRTACGRAATTLASLIAHDVLAVGAELRKIGVPGDGLVWFDQCEFLIPATLSALLNRGAGAGLAAVLTTTAADQALPLTEQAGVLLLHRLSDPVAAERFAGFTGEKLAPAGPDLAAAPGRAKAAAGQKAPAAVPTGPAAGRAGGPQPDPGQLSQLGPYGLVRRPVVPAQSLSRLGNGEHVLIVGRPRRRLVTLGLTVPARIPRRPARPPSARPAIGVGVNPAPAIPPQKGSTT